MATEAAKPKIWETGWTVIEKIGGGGQGQTYLVKKPDSAIRGVLKEINADYANDKKARSRLYQEVANLKLVHSAGGKVPHIIETNAEAYESDVPLYFVMEFLEGVTLEKFIATNGPLDLKKASQVALDLCGILKIAHNEGISHRDIKPKNIMAQSKEGNIAVAMVDFGLSFQEEKSPDLTSTNETMVNEFLRLSERDNPGANRRDHRSDLTSICAIFHYCLTLCVPKNLIDEHGRLPHRRPGFTLDGMVPTPALRDVVNTFFDRGLAVNIDHRFSSALELERRLQEIINPQILSAGDLGALARRAGEAIRSKNRKEQVASMKRRAEPALSAIIKSYQEAANAIKDDFSISAGRARTIPNDPNGYEDLGMQHNLYLFFTSRPEVKVLIVHKIFVVGVECVVCQYSTIESKPRPKDKPNLGEWMVIGRFPIVGSEMPTETLSEQLKICVSQGVELLKAELTKD